MLETNGLFGEVKTKEYAVLICGEVCELIIAESTAEIVSCTVPTFVN